MVKEAQDGSDALIGDISIRGVWQPQSTTILDVRVVDSDAPSYVRKPPLQILKILAAGLGSPLSLIIHASYYYFSLVSLFELTFVYYVVWLC